MNKELEKIKKQLHKALCMLGEYESNLDKGETTLHGFCDSETWLRVVNNTGVLIKKGDLCYLIGEYKGMLSVTNIKHNSLKLLGNAMEDISTNHQENDNFVLQKGTLIDCYKVQVDYT